MAAIERALGSIECSGRFREIQRRADSGDGPQSGVHRIDGCAQRDVAAHRVSNQKHPFVSRQLRGAEGCPEIFRGPAVKDVFARVVGAAERQSQ
jgi:hypothetical protein